MTSVPGVLSISIVGTGAVARAIARAHADAGGRVVAVQSRFSERAAALAARVGAAPAAADGDLLAADVVVVAVSDRAVAAVGARLERSLPLLPAPTDETADAAASPCAETPLPLVLHTSGALPGAALGRGGLRTGSLHPLQTFPAPERGGPGDTCDPRVVDARLAARVPGTHWFHEGAGEAAARALVDAWGGEFHALSPGAKALYHAAAAIVSNHTVALFDAATQILGTAGIAPQDARAPLAALLAGTTENLRDVGAPAALTGPVARGDVETVEQHLAALRCAAPHLVASYAQLALLALDAAVRRGGLDGPTAVRLRRVLSG